MMGKIRPDFNHPAAKGELRLKLVITPGYNINLSNDRLGS
jgi:hypothetical protein